MLARLILLPLALLLMGNAPAAPNWLSLDQLKAKYQDSQSRYATIAGLKVHYKDEGLKRADAPVLLLVHGSSSTLKTWDAMVPLLKAHYRVIRQSRRARGRTCGRSPSAWWSRWWPRG